MNAEVGAALIGSIGAARRSPKCWPSVDASQEPLVALEHFHRIVARRKIAAGVVFQPLDLPPLLKNSQREILEYRQNAVVAVNSLIVVAEDCLSLTLSHAADRVAQFYNDRRKFTTSCRSAGLKA